MRTLRSLAAVAAALLVAVPAFACTLESAYVHGTVNAEGQFVVAGVIDAQGNQMDRAAGFVFETISFQDEVALPAGSGTPLYIRGDLDFDNSKLHVASVTSDPAVAMASMAQGVSAGAGCAAAKAGCSAAKAASAGSGCSAAKAASAGSGCSAAKAAAAKTASYDAKAASSGCSAKATSAKAAARAASYDAKAAGSGCSAAAKAATYIVYEVSGMTCGGCVSKVEAAVAQLKLQDVDCTVDLDKATVTLALAQAAQVDGEAVAQAITAAGFQAKIQPAGSEG